METSEHTVQEFEAQTLELELLDPVLFLTEHPEGAATFARLLAEQFGSP